MATTKSTSPARKGPAPKRITASLIQNATLPAGKVQHDIFDTVLPGFGLRVGKHRRSYFCMVRALKAGAWKQARVTLGTSAELTLTQAREQARKAMELAQQGKDPTEARSERKTAMEASSRDTYASVRADFLKRYIG
ncbi:MAG: Arm DNA-binding domain-containing protein, partial [Thiohalocapsa sp.]